MQRNSSIMGNTNPLDPDVDDDSLLDDYEISIGTYPLNPDPDEDGIIDYAELKYGTNPEFRDSDSYRNQPTAIPNQPPLS